ncbi:MAG: bis(5'-nucleosyl)-tetraphosphatase (symmetrical) YqeK [Clostridiales bacterium]|nr:bis(5'-nucleosyl)-tetraphosphatase (symmetrical) YqeK [Clostridiales bacterium]
MNREEIKKDLKKLLSEKRYEHTLGVEYTAACLAIRYGADMDKAALAGLLHDCAKYLSADDKIRYSKRFGMPISEYERKNPELLHAKLGACFAHAKYGVSDPEILSAITWHTTGKPNMSLMDKILYIADYIEPNRCQASNLKEVRALAFRDIDECLCLILKDSVKYLATKKSTIDPTTRKTWEYYKEFMMQMENHS